jgi:hypothetical protein
MSTDRSRWPRLPPRNRNAATEEVQAEVSRSRDNIKQEQKRLRVWLKDNADFNTEPFIDQWVRLREEYREEFLKVVVQHMSVGDAVGAVNEMLHYGFHMEDAGIDSAEVEALVGKLFRIHAMRVMLKNSELPKVYKADIMRRIIAREFPNRDGSSGASKAERPVQVNMPRNMQQNVPRTAAEPSAYQQRVQNLRSKAGGNPKVVKHRQGDNVE